MKEDKQEPVARKAEGYMVIRMNKHRVMETYR
jgi:hypothetical protein